MSKNVLLVGESWFKYEVHVKGFDSFYTSTYETGEKWLTQALESAGYKVDFMPNHIAINDFPFELEELQKYDVIILSDIGSNTLLLPPETFNKSERRPNRCQLIKEYVLEGGGLCMIGGYMTFAGIDGKGRWYNTAVQDVLPVQLKEIDDREEHSEGVVPKVETSHPIIEGINNEWPFLLGYNKTFLKEDAIQVVSVEGDPLIAVSEYGKGRTSVFTSDCAPHWAPPEFCEWEDYNKLWGQIIDWTANL